jgi:hypothetical protein
MTCEQSELRLNERNPSRYFCLSIGAASQARPHVRRLLRPRVLRDLKWNCASMPR